MDLDFRPEDGLLTVIAKGEFLLEQAQQTFLDILKVVSEKGILKVLFDGRELVGEPMVIERFYYGEFAATSVENVTFSKLSGHAPQFAYVLHEPLLDPLRLGETVAVNRGMNVKAFNNIHEARQWLNISPVAGLS
jgi:hypothetical protein